MTTSLRRSLSSSARLGTKAPQWYEHFSPFPIGTSAASPVTPHPPLLRPSAGLVQNWSRATAPTSPQSSAPSHPPIPIFAHTDFWATYLDPSTPAKSTAANKTSSELAFDLEIPHSMNIAKAAAGVQTLERFIYSALGPMKKHSASIHTHTTGTPRLPPSSTSRRSSQS
jgi:hypothetical protein